MAWYDRHGGDEMANVQKYTRADVGGGNLTRHYERAKDEHGNYHQWGNQEIDPSRSHLNYNLSPEREQEQLAFINERISEVKCHKRDDVNIMCSWIVTAPKELREDEYERFFKESYDFLCKKYDEKNVVSAWVHMDETTPHLHFAFVPVVKDRKKGHEKVSAKEALGWSEKGLYKFHGELDTHMTAVFGREIGILNEATKEGNKSIDELKRGTAQAEKEQLIENVSELHKLELELQKGNKLLEIKSERLNGQIKTKEDTFRTVSDEGLKRKEVLAVKPVSKIPFSKNRAIYFIQEIDSLKKTALQRAMVAQEIKDIESKNIQLTDENKKIKKKIKMLEKQIPKEPSLKEKLKEAKEESRISEFRKIPEKDQRELLDAYHARNKIKVTTRLKTKQDRS